MLPIQTYLKTHNLYEAKKELELEIQEDDNLVLLNYSQLSKPNTITSSCRGTILEKGTWDLVAFSFNRFFNQGQKEAIKIDWESAQIQEKLDGSLITIYTYKDKVRIATRGSINASGSIGDERLNPYPNKTFYDAVLRVLKEKGLKLADLQNQGYCYIFEYIGPLNTLVVKYPEEDLILLNVVEKANPLRPILLSEAIRFKPCLSVFRQPKLYNLTREELDNFDNYDEQFEGYVVVDKYGGRIKVKNPKHLMYFRLLNVGNKLSMRRVIEMVVDEIYDDVIAKYPKYIEIFEPIITRYKYLDEQAELAFSCYKGLGRKELAKALFERYSDKNKIIRNYVFSRVDGNCKDFKEYMSKQSARSLIDTLVI